MPQMYPALWGVMYLYFMTALFLFAAMVYFSHVLKTPQSETSGVSAPTLEWGW